MGSDPRCGADSVLGVSQVVSYEDETPEQTISRIYRQATEPRGDHEATDPEAVEWADVVEIGKPSYRGLATVDPVGVEQAVDPNDEWAAIRAQHGRNDYHLTSIFRRVQRRED